MATTTYTLPNGSVRTDTVDENGNRQTVVRGVPRNQCTPEEFNRRMVVCSTCSEYIPDGERCAACKSCNRSQRMSLLYSCPLLKW